jgi:hypothetical protein
MHKALFWVAVAVLQLDEVNLYSAGTALLEQNLHTLDSLRVFNDKVLNTQTTFQRDVLPQTFSSNIHTFFG